MSVDDGRGYWTVVETFQDGEPVMLHGPYEDRAYTEVAAHGMREKSDYYGLLDLYSYAVGMVVIQEEP